MDIDPLIWEFCNLLSEQFPHLKKPEMVEEPSSSKRTATYRVADKDDRLSITASIEKRNGVETFIIRWLNPQGLGAQETGAVIDALGTLSGEYGLAIKVLGIKGAAEEAFWTEHHYVPNGHFGWIPNPDL